ncbi:MAG: hypothetical protein HY821_22490 [Acidobacteria bacterium]|nr:hypothetical protein [Acidobacteriota bacterium]
MKALGKLTLAMALCAMGAAAQDIQNVSDEFLKLLRSDVKAKKAQILKQVLSLDEEQGKKFWPVQGEYEAELGKVNGQLLSLAKEYSDAWGNLTDAQARTMTMKWLDLAGQRLALQKKYFEKVSKAVSPTVAAKFIQIERQVLNALDAQLAAAVPLVR